MLSWPPTTPASFGKSTSDPDIAWAFSTRAWMRGRILGGIAARKSLLVTRAYQTSSGCISAYSAKCLR